MPSKILAPDLPAAGENPPDATPAIPAQPVALRTRRIWRDAALAWLAQHLFFTLPIYLDIAFAPARPLTLQRLGLPWLNWDGWIYVDIAQHGYRTLSQAAFFPLYPLLTRAVSVILGGHTALAALLVANAASFGAYGFLLLLVEREYGRVAARRTLLFLLCFPASFFLAAAYTESLFLLLSLGAFLALRRHAWIPTGLFAALAALTRPVGILLVLPIAIEIAQPVLRDAHAMSPWRTIPRLVEHIRRMPRALAALALPVVALAGYCAYLALRFGQPLGFLNAEGGTWGRRASWPWDSFLRAGAAVLRDPPYQALPAALDLALMGIFVVVTYVALRRLPASYALYALASLALIVLLPMHREDWGALSSNKRFLVDVFPFFVALGVTRSHRWIEPIVVILALLLQVLLTVVYLQRGWVA